MNFDSNASERIFEPSEDGTKRDIPGLGYRIFRTAEGMGITVTRREYTGHITKVAI